MWCISLEFLELLQPSKVSWLLRRPWLETTSPAEAGWSGASSFWSSCPACLAPARRWPKTSLVAAGKPLLVPVQVIIARVILQHYSLRFANIGHLTCFSSRVLWVKADRKLLTDLWFIPWGVSRSRRLNSFFAFTTWCIVVARRLFSGRQKTLNWSDRDAVVFIFLLHLLPLWFLVTVLNNDSLLLEGRNEHSGRFCAVLGDATLAGLFARAFTQRRNKHCRLWRSSFAVCRTWASCCRCLRGIAFKTLCSVPL